MTRPQNKKLKETVQYLESIGLEIVGSCICLESGIRHGAMMNYSADEVIKYRKLYESNSIETYNEFMERI